jgi:DNA primase
MLLSDAQIEQIASANDIVEVVSSYFPLKRAGSAWTALCPFHQERSPSFRVNPQRQMFKCFGCGAGGSVFRFVMDYEHIDFPTAARKLAERAGIRMEEQELSPEDYAKVGQRKRLLALHAAAADWFHARLMKGQGGDTARQYLKSRGINSEVARSWKIGYAPESWDALLTWAQREGYNMEALTASGLITTRESDEDHRQARTYDRFRHRVMFPICNDLGEVIAFSGRTLEANPKAAKYVNSPETPLFNKGSVLFGLHKTKRALIDKQSAIVCEGQLDLITAFEAGVQNCIAPQGTAFTEKQARILKRYVEEVVLCFDADPAGEKAAERSLASLLAEGLSVRLASMPPGEDPDSLIRTHGAEAFMARITGAKDFFDFQLDRLATASDFQSPKGRANAARKLAGWAALVTDPLLRDGIVNKVSVRLTMPVRDFTKAVASAKPRESGAPQEPAPAGREMPKLTDTTLLLLAQVALQSTEAREWLLATPWRGLLENEPEAGLVAKILEADLKPEQNSSTQVFLTTLEPNEEAVVCELLTRKVLPNAAKVASVCWDALASRQVRRHLDQLEAQVREPAMPIQERLALLNAMRALREEHKVLLGLDPDASPVRTS